MQSQNLSNRENVLLQPVELLKRTARPRSQGELAGAARLLEEFLRVKDNVAVWKRFGDVILQQGQEFAARAVYRNVILKFEDPHIKDIITARIPFCKPIVLDEARILYFDIPKCGSSSVKDAIIMARGGKRMGEFSHAHTNHLHKVIPFEALDTKYAHYNKIAIVRHPIARLRSYFKKNVTEAESLVDEARGEGTYFGLDTRPSYREVLVNFFAYRQHFDDFRHHTDTIVGYLGRRPERYTHLMDLLDTQVVFDLLSAALNTKIDSVINMKSPKVDVEWIEFESAEQEIVERFYREELSVYGKFMRPVE